MKFNICVSLFLFLATSVLALNEMHKAIIQAKFLASGVKCLKDHPLSFSDIRALRNKMLPEGEDAKCFAQCLFQKLGIMDDMGKLSSTGARQSAVQVFKENDEHLPKIDQFIQECSSVNDHNLSEAGVKGCDRAKLAFACLVEKAPQFGFDVDF